MLEIVGRLSPQKKLSLYSAAIIADVNDGVASSSAVYKLYQTVCEATGDNPYTQETVNRHLKSAGTYGVLENSITSEGFKRGINLQFTFTVPVDAVINTLEKSSSTFDSIELSKIRSHARAILSKS
nr:hypothetical protein [Haloferax elongans]